MLVVMPVIVIYSTATEFYYRHWKWDL